MTPVVRYITVENRNRTSVLVKVWRKGAPDRVILSFHVPPGTLQENPDGTQYVQPGTLFWSAPSPISAIVVGEGLEHTVLDNVEVTLLQDDPVSAPVRDEERLWWMILAESEHAFSAPPDDSMAQHNVNVLARRVLRDTFGVNLDNLGEAARVRLEQMLKAQRNKVEAETAEQRRAGDDVDAARQLLAAKGRSKP